MIEIVNSLDEETWRQFVDGLPNGNIFHTPEMFQVYSRAKGYRPKLWASIDAQAQIQTIVLPIEVTLKGGLLRYLTTRAIAYGGVLSKSIPEGKEALAYLLKAYREYEGGKTLLTELRHLSDTGYIQTVLQQNNFFYEDHLDYLIDLACSPDQVFQNIGARTRKHLRKGLLKGSVIVHEVFDRQDIPGWYDLVDKAYKNARVPLADISLFEAAFDILYPKGMVKFWLARIDGTNVAASVELLYKDIIYGWYGGVDRTYIREVPGEMLMWHILKWGVENGYHIYDFGGAGKPNEEYGVRDFKAKFGGTLVCYGRNTYIPNPMLVNFSELGYKLYRKLYFKL